MNGAQVHLILNHVPIYAVLFGLALFAWSRLRANREITRVALVVLVFAAMAAIPVYFSGEPAEERIEHAAGVSKDRVERHEDAAKVSVVLVVITGLAALVGLMRERRPDFRWLALGILALGLVAALQIAWTAHLGGSIRHPELNGGTAAVAERQDDR